LRKAAGIVAVSCAWIYTAAHFAASGIRQPLTNFSGDFLASFPSWRLSVLLGRLDLYQGSLAAKWAVGFGVAPPSWYYGPVGHPLWHYGPVEHLITLPLFAFPDLRSGYIAWLLVNYVFLIAILILAARGFESGRQSWIWWSVSAIAILNYGPMYEAITQRTIEIFELVLLFTAFAMMQRVRAAGSGFTIGIAAMTKFLPLIFLPYFLVKKKYRALVASMLAIVPIAIATELVFGWRYSGTVVQLRHGSFIDTSLNQSLSGMIIRLLKWTRSSLSPALLSSCAIVVALAGVCWLFLRVRNCTAAEDLEWSTLIVAMVLLPPHNQQYYFMLLLFPYLALLARELQPGAPAHHARRWWLAISFVLTGTVMPLSLLSRVTGFKIFSAYLAFGIPFVGAAILATICVRALLDECTVSRDQGNHPGTPHAV
jgi:hypothetical protein